MGKPTIYFAHPYRKRGTKREEMIKRKLSETYEVIDPFEGEDSLCRKFGCESYYDNPTRAFAKAIKSKDFGQVDSCDAIFAWIIKNVAAVGTIRELDRAIRIGKHTIVLGYKPNPFLEDVDELYLSYKDFLDGKLHKWDGKWRS